MQYFHEDGYDLIVRGVDGLEKLFDIRVRTDGSYTYEYCSQENIAILALRKLSDVLTENAFYIDKNIVAYLTDLPRESDALLEVVELTVASHIQNGSDKVNFFCFYSLGDFNRIIAYKLPDDGYLFLSYVGTFGDPSISFRCCVYKRVELGGNYRYVKTFGEFADGGITFTFGEFYKVVKYDFTVITDGKIGLIEVSQKVR